MAQIDQSDLRIFIAKLEAVESALAEIRSSSVRRSHRNLRNHVASSTSTKGSPSARDANSSPLDHGSSTDNEKRLATIEEAIREIREAIKPIIARTPASSLPTNNRATTATTHVPTESVPSLDLPSNTNADSL
uniref:Uncharacterized protein n=1 Tax=Bionectria ochroleuca TaxID=29856 RepID=A0A8H7K539_BIOOC